MIPEGVFRWRSLQLATRSHKAADDHHEAAPVIAVFSTTDGHFRYAVDMEGYGALEFFTEEYLSFTLTDPDGERARRRSLPDIGAEADIARWAIYLAD